jgi:hypothetical protein
MNQCPVNFHDHCFGQLFARYLPSRSMLVFPRGASEYSTGLRAAKRVSRELTTVLGIQAAGACRSCGKTITNESTRCADCAVEAATKRLVSAASWVALLHAARKLVPNMGQHGEGMQRRAQNGTHRRSQPGLPSRGSSPVLSARGISILGTGPLATLHRPAAVKVGITKRIGWHTFRHSYSTLLKASGADIKVT